MQRTNLASAECYLRWQAASGGRQVLARRLLADPVYVVWGVRNA